MAYRTQHVILGYEFRFSKKAMKIYPKIHVIRFFFIKCLVGMTVEMISLPWLPSISTLFETNWSIHEKLHQHANATSNFQLKKYYGICGVYGKEISSPSIKVFNNVYICRGLKTNNGCDRATGIPEG